jgi:prevent-host-death family protein
MSARVTEFAAADAKARFSELLSRAEAGEEITIKKHGQPVARLVPVSGGDLEVRRQRHEEFVAWVKSRPVYAGRIDYKALINEGRR